MLKAEGWILTRVQGEPHYLHKLRLSAVLQIRCAREENNRTQTALARLAGMSQQQVVRLEDPDGIPTLATLEKVADALGLRMDIELSAA